MTPGHVTGVLESVAAADANMAGNAARGTAPTSGLDVFGADQHQPNGSKQDKNTTGHHVRS